MTKKEVRDMVKYTSRKTVELIKDFNITVSDIIRESEREYTNDELVKIVCDKYNKSDLASMVFGLNISVNHMLAQKSKMENDIAFI